MTEMSDLCYLRKPRVDDDVTSFRVHTLDHKMTSLINRSVYCSHYKNINKKEPLKGPKQIVVSNIYTFLKTTFVRKLVTRTPPPSANKDVT